MASTEILQRTHAILSALRASDHDDQECLSHKASLLTFMRQVMAARLEGSSLLSPATAVAQIAANLRLGGVSEPPVERDTATAQASAAEGAALPLSASPDAQEENDSERQAADETPGKYLVEEAANTVPHSTSRISRQAPTNFKGKPPCVPSEGWGGYTAHSGPSSAYPIRGVAQIDDSAWVQKPTQRVQTIKPTPAPTRSEHHQMLVTPQWDKVVRRLSWQAGATIVQARPRGQKADLRTILGAPRAQERDVSHAIQSKRRCVEQQEQQMLDSAAKGSAEEIEETESEPAAAALGMARTRGDSFSPVSETPSSMTAANGARDSVGPRGVALERAGVSGRSALCVCFSSGTALVLSAGAWSPPDRHGWASCGLCVWRLPGQQQPQFVQHASAWCHTSAGSWPKRQWLDLYSAGRGGGNGSLIVLHSGHIIVGPQGYRPAAASADGAVQPRSTMRATPLGEGCAVELTAPGSQPGTSCVLCVPKGNASAFVWLLGATTEGNVLLWDTEEVQGSSCSEGTFLPVRSSKGLSSEFTALTKCPRPGHALGLKSDGQVLMWSCQTGELLAVCEPTLQTIRHCVPLELPGPMQLPAKGGTADRPVVPFFALVDSDDRRHRQQLAPVAGILVADSACLGDPLLAIEGFLPCCAAASGHICVFGTETGDIVVGDWSQGSCRALGVLSMETSGPIEQLFVCGPQRLLVAGAATGETRAFDLTDLLSQGPSNNNSALR